MLITLTSSITMLNWLSSIDPSPFFILSLFPYLFFLYFAQKANSIPKTALWGYRLTLLFVLMTIIFAILAQVFYNDELTNIDPLHGAAESFLTISDAVIVIGFIPMLQKEVKNS